MTFYGQATAMAFYGLSKLPFASPQTLQNSQNAPNPPKPAKPSKHRPQQAPQIHSNDFFEAFKAAVCQPAKAATPPSPTGTPGPRPLPQQAPQGQGHFPNRHPKARPQQWLSMGFQSCRLPARKRSKTLQTLQTLQNPLNPPNTVPSRHPRSTAMTFLRLSKLCLPARKSCNPTFPNRHPRARPQQWLSMGFQSCRLPARKPSKTLQTLQTLQNPPNPPNTVPSRHPRSTAMTFLRLSRLPFASPQRLQPPQNSKYLP